MTAYEWCEVLAIGAVIVTAVTWLNRGPNADDDADRQQWQASTRTEEDVKQDLAQARADLADCIAIWNATQHDIPHQTRRTEEDQ